MARDVIVIGAGGGGPVVAKELAARGLDVLLLEAGPRHADPEAEWRHFENEMNNPITGVFRFGPADRTRPAWSRELPHNGAIQQVSGVGGTTQHYFGNCPRAMPGAFLDYSGADRAAYDTAHLFPFRYEELIPYYEWVEATLPVQTAAMGTKEQVFFRGCEGLGLPVNTRKNVSRDSFRPQENAILQPSGNAGRTTDAARLVYPQAGGCTFCGYCLAGCYQPRQAPRNLKAKRSTDNSYVPMALTASRWARHGRDVTLIVDAFVTQIHTANENGVLVARAVTWRVGATGESVTEDARVIVMAGGCIENPRLWLNSGLPNPNDWVGRGLTDHHIDMVTGLFPFETGGAKGAASAARADFPGRGMIEQGGGVGPAFQVAQLTFSDAGIAGRYDNGLPDSAGADGSGRMIGNALAEYMAAQDRQIGVIVITDDDVEPANRVTLSEGNPPDEHGPVARAFMDHRNRSARTRSNRDFLTRQAVGLLRAAGATQVHRVQFPPVLLHIQSSMRMGLSDSDSVCTADGETRAVRRLYIADNSVLANAIGGPNPTLTTQAVATRTAEKIHIREFGGQGWVGREAPMSSIDDAVTAAVIGADAASGRSDDGIYGAGCVDAALVAAAAAAAAARARDGGA